LADVFAGNGSARIRIAQTFVDGGERFPILVIDDRSGLSSSDFFDFAIGRS